MEQQEQPDQSQQRVEAAIERWQRELLDLSRGNRLLDLRGQRGQSGVWIAQPTPAVLFDRLANGEKRQTIVRPVLAVETTLDLSEDLTPPAPLSGAERGEQITRLPPLRAGEGGRGGEVKLRRDAILLDVDATRHDALLYRLRLRARSALLEQGIEILYVAFGLLEWSGIGGTPGAERALSPLLLLPARLGRERSVDPYTLTPLDEPPVLNPALAFQLANVFQIHLRVPEPAGDGDVDYLALLESLREQLAVRPDWTVRDGAYLGLFSFAKQAMYADLAATRDRLVRHPIVRALAGAPTGLPSQPLPEPEQLDELEDPRATFQVLDADASQRTVLAAIRKGGSLVVQGPPGTGKSQTIANAIADALGRGKTVLFVSEKLAALQVVARRLQAAGLGELCLEAHGHGGDKAAIVRALAAAVPETPTRRAAPPLDELRVLAERRAQLNAYARALHEARNPLGASAFAIHGELAKRASAPRVMFDVPRIGDLTMERAGRLVGLVRRLVPLAGVVTAPDQHPWFGCTLTRWNPLVQAQLDTILDRLARAADELAEVQAGVVHHWRLTAEPSLTGARWLAQVVALLERRPPALTRWLTLPSVDDLTEQVRSWGLRSEGYGQRRLRLLSHYREAIFELDLPAIVGALAGVEVGAIGKLLDDGPAPDRALSARPAVEQAVGHVLRAVPATLDAAAALAAQLGLQAPTTRPEIARLLRVADLLRADPRPEQSWLEPGRLGLLENLAAEAVRQAVKAETSRGALLERFDDGVVDAITPALAARVETTYASWTRTLRPGWYADLRLLRRHLRPGHADADLDYQDVATAIGQWRALTDAEGWHATQATGLAGAFGRHYLGGRTDWARVQAALDAVRRLSDEVGDLRQHPRVTALLLSPEAPTMLDRPTALLRDALAALDAGLADLDHVGVVMPSGAATLTLPDLAAELERWLGAFAPLWAAADALHACRRTTTGSVSDLLAEARDALACLTFERDFGAAMPALAEALGSHFQGLKTDWPRVLEALTWTSRLRACFDREPPVSFVAALDAEQSGLVPHHLELARALGRLQELCEEIGGSFGSQDDVPGPRIGSSPIARASFAGIAAWARSRHAALSRLQEWIDAQGLLAELDSAGLGGLMAGLAREAPSPDLWVDAFIRQLFTLWLTWRYQQAPALARFRRPEHEAAVDELCRLDRRQWQLASERISASLLAKRPGRSGLTLNGSEVGLLLREARKQRRFKPLRRLFAELPHLLPQLKPCLLMSPLAVAQHLGDSAVSFDLVIFDEASQILPADAIGAIGRGRQAIVVGDRRQLPPTRFFQATTLDTHGDDPDEEPPESILDACLNAGLPEHTLLWHYRSRHEHLIAFSNGAFYEGRLRTFPSPDADERVVTLHHVPDGVYDRGGTRVNRREAAVVADLMVGHVERQAALPAEERQSLGVIAFSEAQMLAILGELESRKRARPELEPLLAEEGSGHEEGLFVKNLESVQGDERDVILLSVGYGRDAQGRLTMSFGPLNAPGGERRLNVAVTRARRRLTVVTSIRAHDIDGSPERPAGLQQLRRYLEYAERGPSALSDAAGSRGGARTWDRGISPFDEAVQAVLADLLKGQGAEVVGRVGVGEQPIDLAVRDGDGRYLLAIETDGQTFANLPTARDRDRLRHEVLERLGWQVHRVWSTAWIAAQPEEQRRVVAAVERARLIRAGVLADETPLAVLKPEDRPSQGPARPTRRPAGAAPSRAVPPVSSAAPPGDDVAIVAPDTIVPQTVPPSGGVVMGDATVPGETLAPAPRVRAVAPAPPIDKVPVDEIVGAARAVLTRGFAMNRDDLVVAVARELGYQRAGARIKAAVGRVADAMVRDGTLVESGGSLRLRSSDD